MKKIKLFEEFKTETDTNILKIIKYGKEQEQRRTQQNIIDKLNRLEDCRNQR